MTDSSLWNCPFCKNGSLNLALEDVGMTDRNLEKLTKYNDTMRVWNAYRKRRDNAKKKDKIMPLSHLICTPETK